MCKVALFIYILILFKKKRKKKGDMVDDVAQLKHCNNKYYISTFRYIYIYIDIDINIYI